MQKKKPEKSAALDATPASKKLTHADLNTIIHDAPVALAVLDRSGAVIYNNECWLAQGWPERWTRFEASDLRAKRNIRLAFLNVLNGGYVSAKINEVAMANGETYFARWALRPWRVKNGKAQGAILYLEDVTTEHKANALAGERQIVLEAVLDNIDEAVMACDKNGKLTFSNSKLLNYRYLPNVQGKDEALKVNHFKFLTEQGEKRLDQNDLPLRLALQGETTRKRPLMYAIDQETKCYVEVTAQPIINQDGICEGAVSSMHEVTDRIEKEKRLKRSEAEARRIAYTDPLTGYPNRASLQRTLDLDLSTLCEADETLLVLSLDIHRFKAINDIHGHIIGDQLLAATADSIADLAGPRAIVGRLAGDEFLIIVPTRDENPLQIAQDICQLMDGQHVISGHRINAQVMIGAAIWPHDGKSGNTLLKRADMARRYAKRAASVTLMRFDATMEAEATRQRQIEQDLRKTIQSDGLDVAYQTIVEASSGRVLGFEALCRWHHPQHGFIAPDQFIHVAEQTGDILDLGEWILRKVMEDLSEYPGYFVAVNVSPRQFSDTQFVQRLKDALVEFDFDPARLEIEVTENLVVNDPELVLKQIRALQAMGIRIALDDFGTGYSSLAYLQTYKFDKLKIDRTFVNKLGQDREALALMQCMIQMGKAMQMTVVAEGIETEGQALMLRHAGCDSFQGYFYAKPEPWESVREKHLPAASTKAEPNSPSIVGGIKAAG